jgi:flagellar L-ring protein FlgH
MKTLFILLGFLLFSSCSNYVNRVHNQLDRETKQGAYREGNNMNFYKNELNGPKVQGKDFTPGLAKSNALPVERQYKPAEEVKKRYTTKDLYDNSDSGSLWAGEGNDSHLFSENRKKQHGDIIVINVMKNLKEQIGLELKKAFPPLRLKAKKDEPKAAGADGKPGGSEGGGTKSSGLAMAGEEDGQVYDRISSIIVEEINADHILLRGRKDLIFNDIKRTVEVQAMVPRKAITFDDAVNSNNILESYVVVIR